VRRPGPRDGVLLVVRSLVVMMVMLARGRLDLLQGPHLHRACLPNASVRERENRDAQKAKRHETHVCHAVKYCKPGHTQRIPTAYWPLA
jgi:hypothetical protein